MLPTPIAWSPGHLVRILDQTGLPGDERYLELDQPAGMADAIMHLRVRGAPLIGIAAAMGVTLAARGSHPQVTAVLEACDLLQSTRPTAVNLAWALERMRGVARRPTDQLHVTLVAEANAIWEEDRAMCERIGDAGLPLIPDGAIVLTHCNAGALATGGIGTALAPVYRAQQHGRQVHVLADETRPLLQGSRLTAWELSTAGIAVTVMADGMAASRLRQGGISCVIVGADRIARNGDVANKIGTYGLALAARAHAVPFYVAAPRSTYDAATATGAGIPIEQRHGDELRRAGGVLVAPVGAAVWNPAFDVTPAGLITGYITDAGLLGAEQLSRLG